MAIETIATFTFEKMLDILPGWLARRFISSQNIASNIEIDFRANKPIDICFGTMIPSFGVYFRITNMNPFDIVLDRLLIDIWVRQPLINGFVLERYNVPGRSSKDVYFVNQLTALQIEKIRENIKGQLLSVPVTINLRAFFNSKFGWISINKRLETSNIPCI